MYSPPLRNSRIRLSQGQIFWREIGQGIPLVFLHGSGQDSSQWLKVIQYLGNNYHCFAPDLLGFGDSERPSIHYSINLEVECLASYLEAIHLKEIYLIGHSLGGWIGASYSLKYPDQVKGLILISPEGIETQGDWKAQIKRKLLLSSLWKTLLPIASFLGLKKQLQKILDDRQRLLDSPVTCELLFKRRTVEIKNELLTNFLPQIATPTLIMQGKQDLKENIDRSLNFAELIPYAIIELIEHGDHDLPNSLPEKIVQMIDNFINI
jgi:pimeloyl-ACP methyl ester carboxylesterase